jgi:hypothetical protein
MIVSSCDGRSPPAPSLLKIPPLGCPINPSSPTPMTPPPLSLACLPKVTEQPSSSPAPHDTAASPWTPNTQPRTRLGLACGRPPVVPVCRQVLRHDRLNPAAALPGTCSRTSSSPSSSSSPTAAASLHRREQPSAASPCSSSLTRAAPDVARPLCRKLQLGPSSRYFSDRRPPTAALGSVRVASVLSPRTLAASLPAKHHRRLATRSSAFATCQQEVELSAIFVD